MDTCSKAVCELFICELLALEELLHEFLVSTCDCLVERVLVIKSYNSASELVLKSCDNVLNNNVVLVDLVDNEECRCVIFLDKVPGLLCSDLDAGRSVYHDNSSSACGKCSSCLSCEIEESRSIDEVELGSIVLYRYESLVDGVSFFDLHLLIVRYSVAGLNFSESADQLSVEQSCFEESGLACAAVAQQYDVADLVA